MTLLAPWFLAGLVALAPLVALHLRRRRREQDVASLLLWREPSAGVAPRRRRARLVLPLLLLLQALFLVLLVVALARPGSDGATRGGADGPAPAVVVIDGSTRMAMTDVAPDRLAAARADLDARLVGLPAGTPVSVVVAAGTPRLIASQVSAAAARDALGTVRADAPTADLPAALALAAGQLHRPGGTITLAHAEGSAVPRVRTDGVGYTAVAIGTAADNQALSRPVARCGAAPDSCTVFATIVNEAPRAVRRRLVVQRDGVALPARDVAIAAGGATDVTFAAPAGARIALRLDGADALPVDDRAAVTVPSVGAPIAITLVSHRGAEAPLARALAAIPGAVLRRVAPADAAAVLGAGAGGAGAGGAGAGGAGAGAGGAGAADAADPDLLVLDRWLPAGDALPAARTLLLVAPPRLPGGSVGVPMTDATPSGAQPGADLLRGVDLGGLVIAEDGARRLTLPADVPALAWAPDGPLVAAGLFPKRLVSASDGLAPAKRFAEGASGSGRGAEAGTAGGGGGADPGATGTAPGAASGGGSGASGADPGAADAGGRLAILAVDPERSNLPQLAAFPILLANIAAWATGQPGPGAPTRADDGADPSATPVVLRASAGGAARPGERTDWWPWLLATALIVLLAEWAYPWLAQRAPRRPEAGT